MECNVECNLKYNMECNLECNLKYRALHAGYPFEYSDPFVLCTFPDSDDAVN